MTDVSLLTLLAILVVLLVLSAFFSASETAMMALNRYRLEHLAEDGNNAARLCLKLLGQTDRLLGTILLGNNLVNNAAAAVSTVIALEIAGEVAIAFATGVITLIILIFAEIPPKTVAALYPEKIAFRAVYILAFLIRIAQPIVFLVNRIGALLPRLFGISLKKRDDRLGPQELRTVVKHSASLIPKSHQEMLLRILDLETITVEDVMVPRGSIEGIDLEDDWDDIIDQLATSHHTRLPVYRGNLDNIVGEVHLRNVVHQYQEGEPTLAKFLEIIREPMFIPESAQLTEQLLMMQEKRCQTALVVNEFGEIRGLVTLDEILEEIVGEFTRNVPGVSDDVYVEDAGSYLVDARANIRDLNRKMLWNLPTDGPKTLNGLLLEVLEDVPNPGTTIKVDNLVIEIVKSGAYSVEIARITPLTAPQEIDTASSH
ncbi:MAG: membrane protein [marine bacterium B5-7]|nr:MAG: membrane protein [marine bacterium B5-7]